MEVDRISRDISKRLKESRLSAGLTQAQVAKDFRISRQAVSAWERGESLPSVWQMHGLGLLYGLSMDYAIFGLRTMPIAGDVVAEVYRVRRTEPAREP
jgi:transcriptional regulator with XRE-family HTH domain